MDADLVTEAGETTTVQLAANVGDGDVITFAEAIRNQSTAIDGIVAVTGTLAVTQIALTEFVLSTAGGGGDDNILITANARTTEQAAATLGGGAQTAFDLLGQQQTISGNRLAGLRSTDPRFVSAFAAVSSYANAGNETSFPSGVMDGPNAPQASRDTHSVWLPGFGGVSDADGSVAGAGYDAGFGGAMIGIDGAISDNVIIGAFGPFSLSSVDGAGNAQLDAKTYQIGV